MEQRISEQSPGFVSIVALVETVWVLQRAFGMSDDAVAAAIEDMLAASVLMIENEPEVFAAMVALKESRGSFADALIGALGTKAGCAYTLTFDRQARRLPGFAAP